MKPLRGREAGRRLPFDRRARPWTPRARCYFVDRHQQRIFSWSPSQRLKIVRDAPLDAVNLGVDRSGNVLVLSMAGPAGTVYAFRPDGARGAHGAAAAAPTAALPAVREAAFLLPSTVWADGQFRSHLDLATYGYETLAGMFAGEGRPRSRRRSRVAGRSLVLPAFRVFTQGPGGLSRHGRDGLALVACPRRIQPRRGAAGRARLRHQRGREPHVSRRRRDDGTLAELAPFAERGGESVVADREGNVYVANGQIFVYRPTGEPLGRIDVPERPTGLRFAPTGAHSTCSRTIRCTA